MFRVLRCRSHGFVAALVVAVAASLAPATVVYAKKRAPVPAPAPQISNPVLAVVSLKNQRVSIYDANGASLHARVSTGQTGLETPSGVYSVLEKDIDHHSNVYDDAAMPFMQRITWSGLALHAGVLPGYPASHGCVRMPYPFAEQLFPLTRVGMRIVISPDDFAPVTISHPLLSKLTPIPLQAALTPTTFASRDFEGDADANFQPDLKKWPARESELESLESAASVAARAAKQATTRASELKATFESNSGARTKAAKAFRAADIARRTTSDQLARAARLLIMAQTPAPIEAEEKAKAKALAASQAARQTLDDARAAMDNAENQLEIAQAAFDTSADKSPRRKETMRDLNKQKKEFAKVQKALRAAEKAKQKANDRVANADRDLFLASQPRPTRREEDAKARALIAATNANTKYAAAVEQMQDADRQFETAKAEYAAAEAARTAAAATAQISIGRTKPVSLFVSLKTKRLYVRQGFAPVLDLPIAIAEPEKPIGTHVFTAVDYTNQGEDLHWTAVSVGRNRTDKDRSADSDGEIQPTDANTALSALDRLTIPPEILARYAGYVWPGSSLIISDEAMSSETSTATDFVVVMNNEPQGGLKSRKAEVDAARRKRHDDDDDDDDRRGSRFYRPEQSSFFTFW